jgi:putative membrane protein
MTKKIDLNGFSPLELLKTPTQIATAIAILFHLVGLVGILVFKSQLIINSTAFNLLLSFGLLLWTQEAKNWQFYCFVFICIITGFAVELIGVNTGLLFGNYSYGKVLGPQWKAVPFMIGINWFIIIFCCGISMQTLLKKAIKKVAEATKKPPMILKALSLVTEGATMALAFDWLMEPVAVKLGFWSWGGDGSIPFYNYVCWFIISMLLLLVFHNLAINKKNIFAVHLLLIQTMFFLFLRTFL